MGNRNGNDRIMTLLKKADPGLVLIAVCLGSAIIVALVFTAVHF